MKLLSCLFIALFLAAAPAQASALDPLPGIESAEEQARGAARPRAGRKKATKRRKGGKKSCCEDQAKERVRTTMTGKGASGGAPSPLTGLFGARNDLARQRHLFSIGAALSLGVSSFPVRPSLRVTLLVDGQGAVRHQPAAGVEAGIQRGVMLELGLGARFDPLPDDLGAVGAVELAPYVLVEYRALMVFANGLAFEGGLEVGPSASSWKLRAAGSWGIWEERAGGQFGGGPGWFEFQVGFSGELELPIW